MPNESILRRIARRLRVGESDDLAVVIGTDDQALPPPKRTTEKETRRRRGQRTSLGDLDDDRQRRKGYRQFRQIDANVPEFSRALTIIATNATAGDRGGQNSYRIEFAQDLSDASQEIILDLERRTALRRNGIYGIIRGANKFGDVFKELTVDTEGLIWRLKHLIPDLTTRVCDEYDRHVGFVYEGYESEYEKLKWWQVVHLRHDLEDGAKYGRSLFAGGGRRLAQQLLAVRDAVTFETLNRANGQHLVTVGYPLRMPEDERDDWIDDLRDELSREVVVDDEGSIFRIAQAKLADQDILIPYPVDFDGRGNEPKVHKLQNAPIGDVQGIAEHLQDGTFVVSGVPKAFFGIERAGEGLGATRLDKQDIQFARQLRRDQEDAAWFVLEIYRRQFIFLGLPLEEGAITIHMPDLREVDRKLRAEIMELRMNAVKLAVDSGLPARYVWYEVIFDGNADAADAAAKIMGIDLDEQFKTAAERSAGEGAPAEDSAKKAKAGEDAQDLRERGFLVAQYLDAAGRVSVSNELVRGMPRTSS